MREWRARKKAKLSNVDGGSASPNTPAIGASSTIHEGSLHGRACSTVLEDAYVNDKENLDLDDWLHRNDTYRARINARKVSSLHHAGDGSVLDGVTQCQTIQIPTVEDAIPDTEYVKFDSALFEPTNEGVVGDGHPKDAEGADNDFDDSNQVLEDDGYESYRVDVSGVNRIGTDDLHDCVYHKLPKTHHVLKESARLQTLSRDKVSIRVSWVLL